MSAKRAPRLLLIAPFLTGLLAGCDSGGNGEPSGPAAVTTQPSDLTVTEGEDAMFTIVATGQAPVSYQWRRDGEDIPYATKPSFTVFAASPAVSGTRYSCVVSNVLGGEASDAATLTVEIAPPTIDMSPRDQVVTAGQDAQFYVEARGSGVVEYQWQRDGADIPGANSHVCALQPAELSDDGAVFRCVVRNEAGSVTSGPATLTVTDLAILTPAIPGALTGQDYSFQLEGSGGTLPYTWTVTQGAPPAGLTLDTGGVLSGNGTALGTEVVTVELREAGGLTVTRDFMITVHEPAIEIGIDPPFWEPSHIWGATGEALTATLTATGGSGPYTWSVALGSLPDGLTLDPDTGVISGTPPHGGSQDALVEVTDSLGNSNRATVGLRLSPVCPDMPRVLDVLTIFVADGVARQAITTWSASPIQSATEDALFFNSSYPTRLRAFSPPATPLFVSMLPSLGPGEELWELPGVEGGVYLERIILTDSDGRKAVFGSGSFGVYTGPAGEVWPANDSDGDGVPDSCDPVAGDDPSDAIEIHSEAAIRTLGHADVQPPTLVNVDVMQVGVPTAMSHRLIYTLSDESFIAGGEAYVAFPDGSPPQTITVPFAFHCYLQGDETEMLKCFPGSERWALPYIPCDYEIHGVRFWDRHGNVAEIGMGSVSVYNATVSVPASDSDSDGVPDVFDPDNPDSYVSKHEPLPPEVLRNTDSDEDSMPDIWESCYALDPASPADASGDADSDGLTNLDEFLRGDDPYDPDSDNDGTGDAADSEMGSSTRPWSALWYSVYTLQGLQAQGFSPGVGWGTVYDGTCHVAARIEAYYPLQWVKIIVRAYPSGEVVLLEAAKVSDPLFYGMWWLVGEDAELWATNPVGEYFEPCGYFACDTHGRVTGY